MVLVGTPARCHAEKQCGLEVKDRAFRADCGHASYCIVQEIDAKNFA